MKKIILIAVAGLFFAACNSKPAANDAVQYASSNTTAEGLNKNAPVIAFEKEVYEFGTITEGEKVHYDFKFKNTGKTPLIISNATATCGCTVPEPPKEPIQPGGEGVIKVIFDSQGKLGLNDKIITITSNATPSQSAVHLIGEVKSAK